MKQKWETTESFTLYIMMQRSKSHCIKKTKAKKKKNPSHLDFKKKIAKIIYSLFLKQQSNIKIQRAWTKTWCTEQKSKYWKQAFNNLS